MRLATTEGIASPPGQVLIEQEVVRNFCRVGELRQCFGRQPHFNLGFRLVRTAK